MSRTFTCALCHGVFEKDWTDEEAAAEYGENFPLSTAAGDDDDTVCEPCYQRMQSEWPSAQFEAERFGGSAWPTGRVTKDGWREFCAEQGYEVAVLLPDGRGAFVGRTTFRQAWLGIGDTGSVDERYTYSSLLAAVVGLSEWSERGFDGEPEFGWHRHQPSNRRRPDGDHTREYIQT